MSMRSIEGSARYSTGVSLLRSSCEAVANFSKASAQEFFTLGMFDLDQHELLQ